MGSTNYVLPGAIVMLCRNYDIIKLCQCCFCNVLMRVCSNFSPIPYA